MKTIIKKLVLLSFILTFVFLTGCSTSNGYISRTTDTKSKTTEFKVPNDLDKVISDYIIKRNLAYNTNIDKQFEVHKTYGIKEENGLINVYVYSLYEGFAFVDGKFKSKTGSAGPLLLIIKKEDDKDNVVTLKEPQDGKNYPDSIKKFFPSEYADQALKDSLSVYKLENEINKQATAWLKENGKSEDMLEK